MKKENIIKVEVEKKNIKVKIKIEKIIKEVEIIAVVIVVVLAIKKEKKIELKKEICEKYNLDKNKFIASFGTSQDFKEAILSGSDEVRIGHQIFEVS